jgi:endonuclease/exonuclease/phosphatase family metal-dependent hydrolase
MRLKVATWNISECVSKEWDITQKIEMAKGIEDSNILKEVINEINEKDIDIVGFQEFLSELDDTEKVSKKITENTKLKYYYSFATSPTFLIENGKAGVAIFSKYPIIDSNARKYWNPNLSVTKDNGKVIYMFDKGIITSEIDLGERKINIINSHALAFGRFGKTAHDYPESYAVLDNAISEAFEKNENVIMMGDLNATNIEKLIPRNYNKLKETITDYVSEEDKINKTEKIDYLMVSKNIKKINMQIVNNSSDHYAFILECEI